MRREDDAFGRPQDPCVADEAVWDGIVACERCGHLNGVVIVNARSVSPGARIEVVHVPSDRDAFDAEQARLRARAAHPDAQVDSGAGFTGGPYRVPLPREPSPAAPVGGDGPDVRPGDVLEGGGRYAHVLDVRPGEVLVWWSEHVRWFRADKGDRSEWIAESALPRSLRRVVKGDGVPRPMPEHGDLRPLYGGHLSLVARVEDGGWLARPVSPLHLHGLPYCVRRPSSPPLAHLVYSGLTSRYVHPFPLASPPEVLTPTSDSRARAFRKLSSLPVAWVPGPWEFRSDGVLPSGDAATFTRAFLEAVDLATVGEPEYEEPRVLASDLSSWLGPKGTFKAAYTTSPVTFRDLCDAHGVAERLHGDEHYVDALFHALRAEADKR